MPIPPLASVCTYSEAARPGYSVEHSVGLLMRFAWIERRIAEFALSWLNPTPEWEVKQALALHLYLAVDHARMLRDRIGEMRSPLPALDASPDAALESFLDEILSAQTTLEKLACLYQILLPALAEAYQRYLDESNPLADYPTRRILRILIEEHTDAIRWGREAIGAMSIGNEESVRQWAEHLEGFLKAAGNIDGTAERGVAPKSRSTTEFRPDFYPRRDERFVGQHNYVFPPHEVARDENATAAEKTLALMCKRLLEMDVPEVMARIILAAKDRAWGEFHTDLCRQLWDEMRHAMMGEVYFERLGVDWRRDIPVHTGFSQRLNLYMSDVEAHAVLYAIEQSLMPATTGKRYEWETAAAANDPLAALFQDFDWADEVLHARIGRRWAVLEQGLTREEVTAMAHRAGKESASALAETTRVDEQLDWWAGFVSKVGRLQT